MQDGEAYAYLLSTLAPELSSKTMIETSDPKERAKKVLETAEKLDCTRYVTSKDIVEGSANLNLAFVAQIFQNRLVRREKRPSLCLNLRLTRFHNKVQQLTSMCYTYTSCLCLHHEHITII
jgi:hypothetical protein